MTMEKTQSMLPEAALFDLDGVLLDTESFYSSIWDDINRIYPTGYADLALRIKGMTLPNILAQYFPEEEQATRITAILEERQATMDFPIFEGVMDFLASIKDAGVPMAIVTSSGAEKMGRIKRMHPDFIAYFGTIITDADVKHSKPHPEGYMLAAQRLGADSSRCIVFEDSLHGLGAGRAAGGAVVALATTNARETLVGKADVVLDSFAGLTLERLLELIEDGRSS